MEAAKIYQRGCPKNEGACFLAPSELYKWQRIFFSFSW